MQWMNSLGLLSLPGVLKDVCTAASYSAMVLSWVSSAGNDEAIQREGHLLSAM